MSITAFGNKINTSETLLVLYFFFLPIYPVISIVSLILLTVFVLISGNLSTAILKIRKDKILQVFILFYLLHLIGMLYTSNLTYGFADLMTKLSFLLVPLVFSGFALTKDSFERIKTSIIVSSIVSVTILFGWSYYLYQDSQDVYEFFYSRLSHNRHPTYITIYYNFALLFLLDRFFRIGSVRSVIVYLVSVYLFAAIFLLSARTATIVAFLTFLTFPFFVRPVKVFNRRNILHGSVIVSLLILFYTYLGYSNRFTQVQQEITLRENAVSNDTIVIETPNSTNIRFHLWSNAIQLIARNPVFGVGTGDIKEDMVKIYGENNYAYGVERKFSPHNQFLHTGVILGITGLMVLLIYLLAPLWISYRRGEWLYVFFLVIILMNCMTESILEREAGVLLFTALNMCFYLRLRENTIISNEELTGKC